LKNFVATAVVVTALGAAMPASAARAQTFTVLPVERDARVSASERMAAFSAVQSARVLGPSAQFEPVGHLVHRLPEGQEALADCLEVDCAARLAREAGIDAVLVVAVWPADDGRATSVAVTLVEPGGATHEADADVGEAGVSSAATNAVVAAARQRTLGDGVELRVQSAPEGALVLVDGTEVGVTPYVGAYEAGDHEVEVRLHGESEVRQVVLDEDAVEVEVSLGGGDGNGHTDPYPETQSRSLVSILIPAGLVAGGLGAGIVAIASVAPGTSCEGATCTRPATGAVIGWSIAATLLVASGVVAWFVLDDSVGADQAMALGIGPGGVRLRVPFTL
jgi:hypothetical protein